MKTKPLSSNQYQNIIYILLMLEKITQMIGGTIQKRDEINIEQSTILLEFLINQAKGVTVLCKDTPFLEPI